MKNVVDAETDRPGEFPQTVRTRTHVMHADVGADDGGADSAPSPHDYFDISLASCKALTAVWYAKKKGIPLERVETHVERDDTDERKGIYRLRVRIELHGAQMTAEHHAIMQRALATCPIHKLMTTADVEIEMLAPTT